MRKSRNFVPVIHLESQGTTYTCIAWCLVQAHTHASAFTRHTSKQRYVSECGRDGVMFMCTRVYDVAACRNTVRNLALGVWLVSHPWSMAFSDLFKTAAKRMSNFQNGARFNDIIGAISRKSVLQEVIDFIRNQHSKEFVRWIGRHLEICTPNTLWLRESSVLAAFIFCRALDNGKSCAFGEGLAVVVFSAVLTSQCEQSIF